jgi:hypothetical protein
MALSSTNLAIFTAAINAMSAEAQALLLSESRRDLVNAMQDIVADKRTTKTTSDLTSALSSTNPVTSWATIDAARLVADETTFPATLAIVRTALDAHNNTGLTVKVFTCILAALQRYPA